MQLTIPTIVQFWHDSTLQSKISLVYIVCFHWSMSRWGHEGHGNYTHIIPMPRNLFYHKVCPFSSIWNMLHTQNFAVMMTLVTITVTRTRQVEASQHYCPPNTMLAVPKFHTTRVWHYEPYFLLLGGGDHVVVACGSSSEQECSSMSEMWKFHSWAP